MQARGLSQDEVAAMALQLIDEHGLPDFTMRRLAAALGVQASALYWHFPNKQTLLAEVADRILASEHSRDDEATWCVRLQDEASALRDALLKYRDSAEIVVSTMAFGLGSDLGMQRLTEALQPSPFAGGDSSRAAAVVLHFVLGHVALEQQRLWYDRLGARANHSMMSGDPSPDEDFRFGLVTILLGLDRMKAQGVDGAEAGRSERSAREEVASAGTTEG